MTADSPREREPVDEIRGAGESRGISDSPQNNEGALQSNLDPAHQPVSSPDTELASQHRVTPSPREPMISRAAVLLAELTDAETGPCRFDHNGDCQSHDSFRGDRTCVIPDTKDFLANLPALNAQPDITKEKIDALIDYVWEHPFNEVRNRRDRLAAFMLLGHLRDAILLSLKGEA